MTRKWISCTHCLVLLTTLLLIASCSNSNDNNETVERSDTAIISSGSCGSSSIATSTDTDSTAGGLSQPETVNEVDCGASPENEPGSQPNGTGSVNLLGVIPVIDSAAVVIASDNEYSNHSGIELYLHDGEVRVLEQRGSTGEASINWGIYASTVALSFELASSTPEQFEVGTFEFIQSDSPNDDAHIGANAMFSGIIVYDTDNSGMIDSIDEFMEVTAGSLTITGARPNWSISMDLTLSNGETLMGQFDGDYLTIPSID